MSTINLQDIAFDSTLLGSKTMQSLYNKVQSFDSDTVDDYINGVGEFAQQTAPLTSFQSVLTENSLLMYTVITVLQPTQEGLLGQKIASKAVGKQYQISYQTGLALSVITDIITENNLTVLACERYPHLVTQSTSVEMPAQSSGVVVNKPPSPPKKKRAPKRKAAPIPRKDMVKMAKIAGLSCAPVPSTVYNKHSLSQVVYEQSLNSAVEEEVSLDVKTVKPRKIKSVFQQVQKKRETAKLAHIKEIYKNWVSKSANQSVFDANVVRIFESVSLNEFKLLVSLTKSVDMLASYAKLIQFETFEAPLEFNLALWKYVANVYAITYKTAQHLNRAVSAQCYKILSEHATELAGYEHSVDPTQYFDVKLQPSNNNIALLLTRTTIGHFGGNAIETALPLIADGTCKYLLKPINLQTVKELKLEVIAAAMSLAAEAKEKGDWEITGCKLKHPQVWRETVSYIEALMVAN